MSKLKKYVYIFLVLFVLSFLVNIGRAVNKQIILYQNTVSIEHLIPIILGFGFIEIIVVGYSYHRAINKEMRYPKLWAFLSGITFGVFIIIQKAAEDHYWRRERVEKYSGDDQPKKPTNQNNKIKNFGTEEENENVGYVYILVNSSMPGLVKIGMTTNTPKYRAKQMNKTGVPTPFIVAYKRKVVNPYEIEQEIHKILSEHRENKNREFFRIETHAAINTLNAYLNNNKHLIR